MAYDDYKNTAEAAIQKKALEKPWVLVSIALVVGAVIGFALRSFLA